MNDFSPASNNSLVVNVTILTGRNALNVHVIHMAKDCRLT